MAGGAGAWVVQRRIPVRRQVFPMVETPHAVVMRDMLVDLAPYIFRGRVAGFLTRLSSTGLANVTSGGGQIPVVRRRAAGGLSTCRSIASTASSSARDICLTDCPSTAEHGGCDYVRVERDGDLPAADPEVIDVAVLDMHHGWPNLGHDAIVHGVQNAVCDLQPALAAAGLRVPRALLRRAARRADSRGARRPARDLRRHRRARAPRSDEERRRRRRARRASARIRAGKRRLFAPVRRIRADDDAALLAVCHTFGVMCRWLGVADAVLRGPEKGGKSAGILENVLTPEAAAHPWFGLLARELPDRRRLRILDNRLYDLIPHADAAAGAASPPSRYETLGVGGPRRRRAHDDRGRARSRRRDAAHLRRQPPSRDRQPRRGS